MCHARQQDQWNHTASLLAMQANVHRDPKKGRALRPLDFHPMPQATPKREEPPLKADISVLKQVFVDGRPR